MLQAVLFGIPSVRFSFKKSKKFRSQISMQKFSGKAILSPWFQECPFSVILWSVIFSCLRGSHHGWFASKRGALCCLFISLWKWWIWSKRFWDFSSLPSVCVFSSSDLYVLETHSRLVTELMRDLELKQIMLYWENTENNKKTFQSVGVKDRKHC